MDHLFIQKTSSIFARGIFLWKKLSLFMLMSGFMENFLSVSLRPCSANYYLYRKKITLSESPHVRFNFFSHSYFFPSAEKA
jgi:hypothetical protein